MVTVSLVEVFVQQLQSVKPHVAARNRSEERTSRGKEGSNTTIHSFLVLGSKGFGRKREGGRSDGMQDVVFIFKTERCSHTGTSEIHW